MKVPRVVIAAVLWLLLIEALRGPAAWGVLAVVGGGTVAAVVAEPAIVRLLWWARWPSTPIAVPGHPQVRVLVTRRQAAGIGPAGRRHLIVPAARVGRADLPELLCEARRRQVVASGAFDIAYQWFMWPWQLLGSFVEELARGASRLPLFGFAWRVRFVVAGIAVWQTVVAGRLAATLGIVVVIGLTYLLPWTQAHEERLIQQSVTGLARPVATPSRRRPTARPALTAAANGGRRPCARARRGSKQPCGQGRPATELVTCRGEGIRGCVHGRRTIGRKGLQS